MDKRPLILGVGNPLFGDDGAGIEVVRLLNSNGNGSCGAEVLDGGTSGIYLLPYLENRPLVVIVDAVNHGGSPGERIRLEGEQIGGHVPVKLSEHQVTVREILALLELVGQPPKRVVLLGVQPASLEFSAPLSEPVRAAIPLLAEAAVEEVKRYGLDERSVSVT